MTMHSVRSWLVMRGPVLACALAGACIFNWVGNANLGYIRTPSLFVWWGQQWLDGTSELQHAWILLALAVWLFVRNLRQTSPDGEPEKSAEAMPKTAVAVLCGALFLHGLGFQMQQARVSIVALLLFIWGLLALHGGRRWARAAVFPLSLMLFALPAGFLDTAGFWMRLWVVDASHAILHGLGIDVLRSGTQLFDAQGGYQYDVAAACSGVRSLQALLALSLVAGYLRLRSNLGRGIAVLSSLPLAYLGNVLRIVIIVLAGAKGGQSSGAWVHEVSGLPVFALVLGGVFGTIAVMLKFKPAWGRKEAEAQPLRKEAPRAGVETPAGAAWVLAACTLFCALHVFFWCQRALRSDQGPASGLRLAEDGINPVELPAFIGGDWGGRRQEPAEIERQILPPDTGYSRRLYLPLNKPGGAVFFSVVLSGRDRSSIHRPELCLVGQGWSIERSRIHSFTLPGGNRATFSATLLDVRRQALGSKESVPELVAYWFIGSQDIVATQSKRMWRDALSRLSGRPQRWAYILVQTQASDGEAAALARMQAILDGALPHILVPDMGKR